MTMNAKRLILLQSLLLTAAVVILVSKCVHVVAYTPQSLQQQRQRQQRQSSPGSSPMTTPTPITTDPPGPSMQFTRRRCILTSITVAALWLSSSTIMPSVSHAETTNAAGGIAAPGGILSSKYCAYGQGDGCEDLAEGNAFILELQRRSSNNKEQIQVEARNAYYRKNYPDFFAAMGKTMIQAKDGSYVLVDDGELASLKAQNKIRLEYAKTLGGKVTDLTQKPIPVLKD